MPRTICLSNRQLAVIQAWGTTPDPAAVANQLHISIHTVHTHLKRMRRKLGVRKTVQVWLYVRGEGMWHISSYQIDKQSIP